MIDMFKLFAALALGYLLGSLNTAVIVGKIYGKDIRSHGSKSAGLTNTLRGVHWLKVGISSISLRRNQL